MFNFILLVKRLFAKKPKSKLSWTPEDYEMGRRWAQSLPHPFRKNQTLWDLCYDRVDSVNTIHNLNKFLFNEI